MKRKIAMLVACLVVAIVLPAYSFGQCDSDPTNILVKRKPNDHEHGNGVSGKWCWNPGKQLWEKQLMLYGDATIPPKDHPVCSHLRNIKCPSGPGTRPWEEKDYILFPLNAKGDISNYSSQKNKQPSGRVESLGSIHN